MKGPSLSRRIYNSSFALTISFSFYTLLFLCTLSCEDEETLTQTPVPIIQETVELSTSEDSVFSASSETFLLVEEMAE